MNLIITFLLVVIVFSGSGGLALAQQIPASPNNPAKESVATTALTKHEADALRAKLMALWNPPPEIGTGTAASCAPASAFIILPQTPARRQRTKRL